MKNQIDTGLKGSSAVGWQQELDKYILGASSDIAENTEKNLKSYLQPWVNLLVKPETGGYPSSSLLKTHIELRKDGDLMHSSKKKISGAIKKFTNFVLPDCHINCP